MRNSSRSSGKIHRPFLEAPKRRIFISKGKFRNPEEGLFSVSLVLVNKEGNDNVSNYSGERGYSGTQVHCHEVSIGGRGGGRIQTPKTTYPQNLVTPRISAT